MKCEKHQSEYVETKNRFGESKIYSQNPLCDCFKNETPIEDEFWKLTNALVEANMKLSNFRHALKNIME